MCLFVSGAHAGIHAAVKKELPGASWQRCKVRFMRNILARVHHKEKRRFAAHLKQIWLRPDLKSARRAAENLTQEHEERFPEIDPKKISSTNLLERTTREVRRRSRVVGVVPTVDSRVRLETCYLVEYSEGWRTDRSCIKREKIREALERNRTIMTAQAAS